MYINHKEIPTKHYSILLKNAKSTISVIADELIKNEKLNKYEFFIDGNLAAIIPIEFVENIV